MRADSVLTGRTTLRSVILTAVALAAAWGVGMWVVSRPSSEPLLLLLALGVLVAVARSPRAWLVLVVVLTAFQSYDNVLAGGFLSWSKLLTLAMLAIYGARVVTGRARVYVFRDWLLPLVLILAWGAASILWAFARAPALERMTSLVSLFILQALIYTLFKEDFRVVEMALYAYIGTMTIIAFVGLYASVLAPGSDFARTVVEGSVVYGGSFGTIGRFYGFYSDPNSVAMMLNYAIFMLLAMLSAGRSFAGLPLSRGVLLALVGVLMIALVNTYSGSGLAAFLVGMAYLAYRSRRHTHTLISLALAGGVLYLFQAGLAARLAKMPSTGWEARLPELELGLKHFLAAPITGIGLESFMPKNRGMGLQVLPGVNPEIHNTYLKFLTELGLPGFLLLVWFCVVLIRRYRRNSRLASKAASPRLQWINVGFGACFLGTSVFGLAQGVPSYNPFWILLGLFAVTSAAIERTCHESTSCTRRAHHAQSKQAIADR